MSMTRLWPFADSIDLHADQKEVMFQTMRGMTYPTTLKDEDRFVAIVGLHPSAGKMGRVLEWATVKALLFLLLSLPLAIFVWIWLFPIALFLAFCFAAFGGLTPILEIRGSAHGFEGGET